MITLSANDFNLELLYTFLDTDQIQSDMKHVFNRDSCFRLSWLAFIYMCCMDIIVCGINNLETYIRGQANVINSYMSTVKGNSNFIIKKKNPYFTYSLNKIKLFMDKCINDARHDFLLSDIEILFNEDNFLDYIFGSDVISAFNDIIESTRKRFIITLDDFDTAFDKFKQNTVSYYADELLISRSSFERDWLSTFMLLVIDIKERNRDGLVLYKLIDFCIAIPKDRYLDIRRSDRDSYMYSERYCSLSWSGIELAILLLKRLEALMQYSTDKNKTTEERLEDIFKHKYNHIPTDITFEFNSTKYSMPLFMYVLRHTFWRPRDILIYYSQILAVCDGMKKSKNIISSSSLQRMIKDAIPKLINDEYINEFKTVVFNNVDILEAFRKKKQILNISMIHDILALIDFKTGANIIDDLKDKIEFLYNTGFLGICATAEIQERYNITEKHLFYFNEGVKPLKIALINMFADTSLCIHPIFCEYLQLDTTGQELVLQLDWLKLHENEDLLFATGENFVTV